MRPATQYGHSFENVRRPLFGTLLVAGWDELIRPVVTPVQGSAASICSCVNLKGRRLDAFTDSVCGVELGLRNKNWCSILEVRW